MENQNTINEEKGNDVNHVLGTVNHAYLFRAQLWQYDPAEYILVYAEDEQKARIKGAKHLCYNSGEPVRPKDLQLRTSF